MHIMPHLQFTGWYIEIANGLGRVTTVLEAALLHKPPSQSVLRDHRPSSSGISSSMNVLGQNLRHRDTLERI